VEEAEEIVVGVVADTHVPDKTRGLHPALLPALERAGVKAILHAGDISVPRVLRELEQAAPVTAVRGNRDWAFAGQLAWEERLTFAGVPLVLVHGHGTLRQYLWDKWQFWTRGYDLRRYQQTWSHITGATVIVFGHTHRAENHWQEGRLWFNPGSASRGTHPTFGLLRFSALGQVRGEIVALEQGAWINGAWVRF
jgi:putative phosphoesterase